MQYGNGEATDSADSVGGTRHLRPKHPAVNCFQQNGALLFVNIFTFLEHSKSFVPLHI